MIQTVQPGQPFAPSATAWNSFIEAANAHKSSAAKPTQRPKANRQYNGNLITIQNKSGEVVEQYHALGLGNPLVLPEDNEDEFRTRIVLEGVEPSADLAGRFCIVQETIAVDGFGLAMVSGTSLAWIDLAGEADTHVELDEGTALVSSTSGTAAILWVSGGVGEADATGEQWAVVRFGGGGGGDAGIWIKISGYSVLTGAYNRWRYSWAEQELVEDGVWQAKPAGRSSPSAGWAYNSIEANNGETGIQGNSINIDALPAGVEYLPVQGSPVVKAWPVINCNDIVEWQFSYENAVSNQDGLCE